MLKKVLAVKSMDRSWIIVFAVLCWTFTSASNILPRCLDTGTLEEYDELTQVCCNGVHARFKNGQDLQCCRKFSNDGDNIEERELYNSKTSLCCDGVLYHLQQSQMSMNPQCCGNQVILNHTTEFCCGDKQYTYSKEHSGCFYQENIAFPYGEGEKVCYNMYTSPITFRLHTKVEVEKRGSDCCGLELYKRGGPSFCFRKEMLWPVGSEPEECGPNRTVHDGTKTVCCQDTGKTIPIPQKYIEQYHGITPNLFCLEDELVDLDKYRIVENKDERLAIPKHFEPCGSDYFDKTIGTRGKGICCNGKVHYYSSNMVAGCCGTELIDKNKNNCCNDSIVSKSERCCANKYPYSIYDDVTCCAGKLYNSSYLCCNPQTSIEIPTLKQKRNDRACCGNTTFHPLEGSCCDGKVSPDKKCNLHVEVANMTMKSKLTKNEILKTLNSSIHTSNGGQEPKKKTRNMENMDCPACLIYTETYSDCVKRFKYQVVITNITEKPHKTTIHVLFLEPEFMRKTKMVFHTAGNCKCFKPNTIYNLYTNRNFKDKIEKFSSFRSRFTKRDLFYEVKGNYGNFSPEHKCQVERYYRYKPIVNH